MGIPELLIVLVLVAVFFGAGRLPRVMEQAGKGMKEFKKGVEEETTPEAEIEEVDPPAEG